MTSPVRNPASFRDPSGFVFFADGKNYRQVNKVYAEHYEYLMRSQLYDVLTDKNHLLAHKEVELNVLVSEKWHKTLLPDQLTNISYPGEWCFEQLKDAALLTIDIMKISIEKGMILKDATPYNIQFREGKLLFIDTLSFEKYDEKQPWIAYRQFCETFLFPLLISHYQKTSITPLLIGYPEGIPIHTAARLLPFRSRFNPSVWMHVFLQSRLSKTSAGPGAVSNFSKQKLQLLLQNLEGLVKRLRFDGRTNWNDYYSGSIISNNYLVAKEKIISEILTSVSGTSILDIGANDGHFAILAAAKNFNVIAIDNDEQCIQRLYRNTKVNKINNILPLVISINHPTPAYGFAGNERAGFNERFKPDIVFALALIHHLVLTNNIPLTMIAGYLSQLAPQLVIEFVPKEDEKAMLLLHQKKDIFPEYTIAGFENIFREKFKIEKKIQTGDTSRFIYLMNRL